jgi:hypothetical protein
MDLAGERSERDGLVRDIERVNGFNERGWNLSESGTRRFNIRRRECCEHDNAERRASFEPFDSWRVDVRKPCAGRTGGQSSRLRRRFVSWTGAECRVDVSKRRVGSRIWWRRLAIDLSRGRSPQTTSFRPANQT